MATCCGLLCDGELSAGGDGLRVQRQCLDGFSLQVLTQQTPQLQVLLEEVVLLLPQDLPLQHSAIAPPQQRLQLRELAGLLVAERQRSKVRAPVKIRVGACSNSLLMKLRGAFIKPLRFSPSVERRPPEGTR